MLPGLEQNRDHPYERRAESERSRQFAWVMYTTSWYKAVFNLQTLTHHQYFKSNILYIKILKSLMLYALDSKMITLSPWLVVRSLDWLPKACFLHFCFPLIWQVPVSIYSIIFWVWIGKNKLNQSSLSWVRKPTMWRCFECCCACT